MAVSTSTVVSTVFASHLKASSPFSVRIHVLFHICPMCHMRPMAGQHQEGGWDVASTGLAYGVEPRGHQGLGRG